MEQNAVQALDQKAQYVFEKVQELLGDGFESIQPAEKALFLLGKTGVGKTTTTCFMASQHLVASVDEKVGQMRIVKEKQDASDLMIISQKFASQTKVPRPMKIGENIVYDCPGFYETGEIQQEIANAFFIQHLFKKTKQQKFLLAVSYSTLQDKGVDLIAQIQHFAELFDTKFNLKNIEQSIGLLVTKVDKGFFKTTHVQNTLNSILQDNKNINDRTKQLMEILGKDSKRIHIFYTPQNEGPINTQDGQSLFNQINDSMKFVSIDPTNVSIALKPESMQLTEQYYHQTYQTIDQIAINIIKVLQNECSKIKEGQQRNRPQTYKLPEYFKQLKAKFDMSQIQLINEQYFNEISFIFDLQSTIEKVVKILNSYKSLIEGLAQILTVFISYRSNEEIWIEYYQALKYLNDFSQFFQYITKKEEVKKLKVKDQFESLKEEIDEAAFYSVVSIQIEEESDDIDYYETAKKYLGIYKDSDRCRDNYALCDALIGKIHINENNINRGCLYILDAMKRSLDNSIKNNTIIKLSQVVGKCLFEIDSMFSYYLALECFSVTFCHYKQQLCLKKIESLCDNEFELFNYFMVNAKFHQQYQNYELARDSYLNAQSVAIDESDRSQALQQLGEIERTLNISRASAVKSVLTGSPFQYNTKLRIEQEQFTMQYINIDHIYKYLEKRMHSQTDLIELDNLEETKDSF